MLKTCGAEPSGRQVNVTFAIDMVLSRNSKPGIRQVASVSTGANMSLPAIAQLQHTPEQGNHKNEQAERIWEQTRSKREQGGQ